MQNKDKAEAGAADEDEDDENTDSGEDDEETDVPAPDDGDNTDGITSSETDLHDHQPSRISDPQSNISPVTVNSVVTTISDSDGQSLLDQGSIEAHDCTSEQGADNKDTSTEEPVSDDTDVPHPAEINDVENVYGASCTGSNEQDKGLNSTFKNSSELLSGLQLVDLFKSIFTGKRFTEEHVTVGLLRFTAALYFSCRKKKQ